MKRLTYKNYIEEYEVNFEKSSDKNWSIAESDTHIKITGEPIDKLGELEDVLEKYGIESAEDLDNIINSIRTNTFIDIENKEILELENANLKNELAELKQKAIVPKFYAGQDIFFIDNECQITQGAVYIILTGQDVFVKWCKYSIDLGLKYEYDIRFVDKDEEEIFATKEEAEKKLAEIKGEKDE